MSKLNILFIHQIYNSQFLALHEYLNESNLANSFFLTQTEAANAKKRILNFQADGNPWGGNQYYYSGISEVDSKIAIGLINTVPNIIQKHNINLIVAHGTFGCPLFLFDEIKIPIITYLEFPSYKAHGHDSLYPPQEAQRYCDKHFEMMSWYQVLKSQAVIVPSAYCKSLFPENLQSKIIVQMEGFDISKIKNYANSLVLNKEETEPKIKIGFAARGLGTAKGFEQFIKISQAILHKNNKVHFYIVGDPSGCSYGYEKQNMDALYGKNQKSFKEHVLEKYKVNLEYYTFYDFLSYEQYSSFVEQMDLFLYPLQFGIANWGFFELLIRGKIIIASNKSFIPEIIQNAYNGYLCDYDDLEAWTEQTLNVIDNLEYIKNTVGEKAKITGQNYDIKNITPAYLKIFSEITEQNCHVQNIAAAYSKVSSKITN